MEKNVKLTDELQVKWRVQSTNDKGQKPYCIMIAYVDARDVAQRLDDVFGFQNWSDEYKMVRDELFCRITVNYEGVQTYREDVGSPSNVEKEKGRASDAFKRAAVKFGIGRYIYELEPLKIDGKIFKGKVYPISKTGKFLKGQELTDFCNTKYAQEQ